MEKNVVRCFLLLVSIIFVNSITLKEDISCSFQSYDASSIDCRCTEEVYGPIQVNTDSVVTEKGQKINVSLENQKFRMKMKDYDFRHNNCL